MTECDKCKKEFSIDESLIECIQTIMIEKANRNTSKWNNF